MHRSLQTKGTMFGVRFLLEQVLYHMTTGLSLYNKPSYE